MPSPNKIGTQQMIRRAALLAGIVLGGAFVWVGLLPRLAATDHFTQAIHRLEQKGIDPNALFYSDHPRAWPKRSD